MDKLWEFIYYLAWIFGVLSSLLFSLTIIRALTYDEIDKLKDKMDRIYTSFPVVKPLIVMIICWVWVLIN